MGVQGLDKDVGRKDKDKDKDLGHKDKDKDKNKDLGRKDKDKDKDLSRKGKDKDKDLKFVLKDSLRTRTRINITAYYANKHLAGFRILGAYGEKMGKVPYKQHQQATAPQSNGDRINWFN